MHSVESAACGARATLRRIGVALAFAGAVLLSASPAFANTISPSSLPAPAQGSPYTQTLTTSGGASPYTYSISSGSLPTGLSLNGSSGVISGTPSAAGTFNFTILSTDAAAATASQAYTLSVPANTLTIQPNTLPAATQSSAYSQTLSAVGGNGSYTFSVSSGSLPTGLSLNGTSGVLSGTPTTPAFYNFSIQADDTSGNSGVRSYTMGVGAANGVTISPSSLPNGTQGVAYSQTFSGSGGNGTYTYSVGSGSLPSGLTLGSGGGLTGTPSSSGTFNFTVHALDTDGNTGNRAIALTIGGNTLTINPTTLPNGTQGTAYSQTVSASGGTGPYTYSVSSGSLPTSLSLNASTGAITGTPSATGTYNFTIRGVDSNSNFGTRTYTVVIGSNSLTVNPSSLPGGTVGTGYSQTVSASGGTGPYTYAINSGALPAGLSLNASSGAITGTPSAAGNYTFTVGATDSAGNTGSRSYTVPVSAAALVINPSSLSPATQGVAYSQTISASGGSAPYSYAITSGALPAGLSLNASSGALSGTPSVNGTFNFTVQATDQTPTTGTRAYTLVVGTNSLTVSPTSLPAGTQGTAYSQTVTASGGTGPYTFSVTSGALPAGLTLNGSTGLISGTPTTGGANAFTIGATDSAGNIGSRAYNVNIGTNSLVINPASLPAATLGQAYSQTIAATGGAAPYTYSITAGSLPPGLSFNTTTGAISGTPNTVGASTFTVFARDVNGNTGSRAYTVSTARLDPSSDPEVQALIAAQAAAARRFAGAQTANIGRHLESLHDGFDPCGHNFGINIQSLETRGVIETGPSQRDPLAPASAPADQVARRTPDPSCNQYGSSLSFWTGGTVDYGSATYNGAGSNKFMTSGVTAGIDVRITPSMIVGLAFGYGMDRSDVTQNGTKLSGSSASGMLYASYRILDAIFLDGSLGYGILNFDNTRFNSVDGSFLTGTRGGSTVFGSLALSREARYGAGKIAPYVRADFVAATLDQYAEGGANAYALTYGKTDISSFTGALGVRGSYDVVTSWGLLTPMARLEYRHAFDSAANQSMFYSDTPGTTYNYAMASATRDNVVGSLGLRARLDGATSLELEYGAGLNAANDKTQTLRAAVRVGF